MSEYDELLNQLTDRLTTAGKLIPRMCEALKTEGLRTDDINDRVKKDCRAAGLSDSTIIHNMPDEFKDKVFSDAAKKTSHKKKIVVTTDGSEAADSAAYSKPEPEAEPVYKPEPEPTPPIQQQQAPSKPIPDYKFIKYGTVPEAFDQIEFELKQVMDKKRQCRMGLLIFYT